MESSIVRINLSSEEMKKKIIFRLLYRENAKHLQDRPHEDISDDMVKVYDAKLDISEGTAFSAITYDAMKRLGLTENDLEGLAERNTMDLGVEISSLASILAEAGDDTPDTGIRLISNQKRIYGAAAVLCTDLNLEDCFILPSSVHECLLLRDTGEYVPDELRQMVSDINHSDVRPEEVLSYHVYRMKNGELKVVA